MQAKPSVSSYNLIAEKSHSYIIGLILILSGYRAKCEGNSLWERAALQGLYQAVAQRLEQNFRRQDLPHSKQTLNNQICFFQIQPYPNCERLGYCEVVPELFLLSQPNSRLKEREHEVSGGQLKIPSALKDSKLWKREMELLMDVLKLFFIWLNTAGQKLM